ncbi:MAG: hypothetical protein Q9167_005620 [Letrouitia subvulpina]
MSQTQLPDPTVDLHWSDFKGAIHDIFAQNASRHPARLCVVETQSSKTPRREFTYSQIDGASNILAHHLLAYGVKRGEVVAIYAYRGVDLVVTIMGVLKAGATFSVIDPAYPSDRQIVYLDVSKPRALVVIEKASQEAGQLSDNVRSYIANNLDLRTNVPGLLLQDDGRLKGGAVDGKDVFEEQIALSGKPPNMVIGPDDQPTLSFTSGSEGRPKGVKGRRELPYTQYFNFIYWLITNALDFSLTYYFPWMARTFNLTENDRFTMLSGIGSQLLVPAKEDIQHELLAKWIKREKATVTHLTPGETTSIYLIARHSK